MRPTALFVIRRVTQLVPVVLMIAALNFVLLHLAPGDAADILAGQAGHATPEFVEELRREFGLDRSLHERFFIFIGKVLVLDLGRSPIQQTTVARLIVERLPATLLLMLSAIVLATTLGVLLGVLAAICHNQWVDRVISVAAILVYATPTFWLGLMLIVLFSVYLELLPSGGMARIGVGYSGTGYALDVLRHLVLPAISLALFYVAIYTRLTRSSMLEVYRLDFIRTARSRGLSEGAVARHALRNALLPVVSLAGVQLGHVLGGSILVETVFAWPGLGRLLFDGLMQRDVNLLLGILFVSSVVVILVNLLVDLLYAWLDPRIVFK
jgi:peptide/nickel transport system permease protein